MITSLYYDHMPFGQGVQARVPSRCAPNQQTLPPRQALGGLPWSLGLAKTFFPTSGSLPLTFVSLRKVSRPVKPMSLAVHVSHSRPRPDENRLDFTPEKIEQNVKESELD
nr:hypothetical protein HmN_001006400 [Hymenolepis microstoma]